MAKYMHLQLNGYTGKRLHADGKSSMLRAFFLILFAVQNRHCISSISCVIVLHGTTAPVFKKACSKVGD